MINPTKYGFHQPRGLTTAAAMAGALACAAATGVQAGSNPSSNADPHWTKVSLADVDLGSDQGARVAFQRIQTAAQRLCGEDPAARNVDLTSPYATCLQATIDHAVGVLDSPRVTALDAAHLGRSTVLAANHR